MKDKTRAILRQKPDVINHTHPSIRADYIGTFQKSKKMVFDPNSSTLKAELVNPKAQRESQLVDFHTIKKGLNFHGTAKKDLDKQREEIKIEEDNIKKENNRKAK